MKIFTNYVYVYDILVNRIYWATMKVDHEYTYNRLKEIALIKYPTLQSELDKHCEIVFVKTCYYYTEEPENVD